MPSASPKRKRSIDDEGIARPSPHPGPQRPDNPDELDIGESSSEDEYGPTAAVPGPVQPVQTRVPSSAPARRVMGPSLPPSRSDESGPEEADGPHPHESILKPTAESLRRVLGPAMPPREADEGADRPESVSNPRPEPRRRVLGPAAPPAPLSTRPAYPAEEADDTSSSSSSDSDYGPSLPTPLEQEQAQDARSAPPSKAEAPPPPAPSKRDAWMLVPPSASGPSAGATDPTKLKNRAFRSAKQAAPSGSGISTMWTETPQERLQRLEDEVLGRKEAATSATAARPSADQTAATTAHDAARRQAIQDFRGASLYRESDRRKKQTTADAATGTKKDEEDDDPSARPFDREKDMRLGSRIGELQRREMVRRGADEMEGRFAGGKFL